MSIKHLKRGKIKKIRPLLLLTTFKIVRVKVVLFFFNFPLLSRFSDVFWNYPKTPKSEIQCHMSYVNCLCWSLGHAEQLFFHFILGFLHPWSWSCSALGFFLGQFDGGIGGEQHGHCIWRLQVCYKGWDIWAGTRPSGRNTTDEGAHARILHGH